MGGVRKVVFFHSFFIFMWLVKIRNKLISTILKTPHSKTAPPLTKSKKPDLSFQKNNP